MIRDLRALWRPHGKSLSRRIIAVLSPLTHPPATLVLTLVTLALTARNGPRVNALAINGQDIDRTDRSLFRNPVALISTMNPDESPSLAPISSAWWLGWIMLGLGQTLTPGGIRFYEVCYSRSRREPGEFGVVRE